MRISTISRNTHPIKHKLHALRFSLLTDVVCLVIVLWLVWLPVSHAATNAEETHSLRFDPQKFVLHEIAWQQTTLRVRAYENIPYVARPADAQTQRINIYIPDAYFHAQTINGYNATTAPILLPNQIGAYLPSLPLNLFPDTIIALQPGAAAAKEALARGLIVASPGTRGRTSQDIQGTYIGKSPAAIVDLKAAVRYLRFNDIEMPGDAEKIIANGTSAGGALSALLGASGNSLAFSAALQKLAAAPVRDDIFAVSAYCPITNLEHADAAYEWQFAGINTFKKMEMVFGAGKIERKQIEGVMTATQTTISQLLKDTFPAYVNRLHLTSQDGQALTLDASGKGSFNTYIQQLILQSAQTAADHGVDLKAYPWLRMTQKGVIELAYDQYLQQLGRQKTAPAFDGLDLETGENQLFGDAHTDKRHFTAFSRLHDKINHSGMAPPAIIEMTNPMFFIGNPSAHNARFWRLRHGTKDNHTSLAIPTLLALTLAQHHLFVDFALAWDKPHSGDYDLEALFDWMQSITKPSAVINHIPIHNK